MWRNHFQCTELAHGGSLLAADDINMFETLSDQSRSESEGERREGGERGGGSVIE